MQIFKRRVGQASVLDGNPPDQMSAVNDDRIGVETPENVPVFRDEVLRELSRAAQEALAAAGRADNK
jgi:sRNA-binding carbon storage regulator CsrA